MTGRFSRDQRSGYPTGLCTEDCQRGSCQPDFQEHVQAGRRHAEGRYRIHGPVRLRDVEEAQQRIVSTIRRLEETGEIIIARGGEDEIIV